MISLAFTFGRVRGKVFENLPDDTPNLGRPALYRTCWVVRIPGFMALCYTRWIPWRQEGDL